MSRLFFLMSVAFLYLVAAPFHSEAEVEGVSTASAPTTDEARHNLEQETFFLINKYRKENKLPPLEWSGDISRIARGHSKDMAADDVDFGHDGFGKRVDEIKDLMAGVRGAGENVFKADNPDKIAQLAVDVWLKSPHHLKNIRGDFNYSGMGVWADKEGMVYFTQIFVKIETPAPQTPPGPSPPPEVTSPFNFLAPPKTR